ncbi:MAG: purine-nucleoside phosphorylase [Verrucomicrobiales bacterium]|nr:purine-nucleoside phosphorylase [Verrucomicrobiales bacterium]
MPTDAPHPPPLPASGPDPSATAEFIRRTCPLRPSLGLVLGSGFAGAVQDLPVTACFEFAELPGFHRPGVPGHSGQLLIVRFDEVTVAVLRGRLHAYEGHDLPTVTFPIRVLAALGARQLLLTNAAGGIRDDFHPGDLVIVSDHLNALGASPLRGVPLPGGFVDLSEVYSRPLRQALAEALQSTGLAPREGVYAAMPGPSFETPAEIRALRTLGADLVGMSTVAEAIVARHCGLEVAALSCVTNRAAGLGGRISHEEVTEVGHRISPLAQRVLRRFVTLATASASLSA